MIKKESNKYQSAYCEDLHGEILSQYHKYRTENNLPVNFAMNAILLNDIIKLAKKELYFRKPEAELAGYKEGG